MPTVLFAPHRLPDPASAVQVQGVRAKIQKTSDRTTRRGEGARYLKGGTIARQHGFGYPAIVMQRMASTGNIMREIRKQEWEPATTPGEAGFNARDHCKQCKREFTVLHDRIDQMTGVVTGNVVCPHCRYDHGPTKYLGFPVVVTGWE